MSSILHGALLGAPHSGWDPGTWELGWGWGGRCFISHLSLRPLYELVPVGAGDGTDFWRLQHLWPLDEVEPQFLTL